MQERNSNQIHSEIALIKEWVEKNLQSVRNEKNIAAGLSINLETLRKKFSRTGNGKLWGYVTSCRVERMKLLLASTDMKCFAICLEVGINREDTGSRLFKTAVGMTMYEYRRQARRTNGSRSSS